MSLLSKKGFYGPCQFCFVIFPPLLFPKEDQNFTKITTKLSPQKEKMSTQNPKRSLSPKRHSRLFPLSPPSQKKTPRKGEEEGKVNPLSFSVFLPQGPWEVRGGGS